MSFVITVGFATEHDRAAFVEKTVPKIRGHLTDAPTPEEGAEDGLHRVGLAVTSQSAAKDLCHQIVAFLAHSKTGRVTVGWTGMAGEAQVGEVNAGAARDAEILAMRLGTAAKAHLDAEKAEGVSG